MEDERIFREKEQAAYTAERARIAEAEGIARANAETIPEQMQVTAPTSQKLGTWQRQEAEILRALACLGHAPQALKLERPGFPGVPSEVRDYLEANSAENWKGTRFTKAWGRLLDNKGGTGIRYATDPPPTP